ncbi:hypothetical protein M1105_00265 [Limibaculum sp. FT325]|uniref:hypothetical protein n=1 Tax=Thermohalobaculum sediminis TaxID=2939436 RepID=UPI0020BFC03F|nr:hypothetical protein [Limibaculum sediminis]MCL5775429.1 hypothetical protein [Limibaculum sediminis]
MLGNIDTLHAIHRRCTADQPLTPEMRDWLAGALSRYLEQRCETLNEAFGVIHGRGGVPWWRERAIRRRDEALRALVHEHFSHLSVYARAKRVAELAERYARTAWPRDRALDAMPEAYRGTPRAGLWEAFRAGAKMPVSERRLRTLLGD